MLLRSCINRKNNSRSSNIPCSGNTLHTSVTKRRRKIKEAVDLLRNALKEGLQQFNNFRVNKGYWSCAKNRRKYLDFLSEQLQQKKLCESPYSITAEVLGLTRGAKLLAMYGGSASVAIMTEFPEFGWHAWKFEKSPKSWWPMVAQLFSKDDAVAEAVLRSYINELQIEYGVNSPEEWCNVCLNATDIHRLSHFGGLNAVIQRLFLYPNSSQQNKATEQGPSVSVKSWDSPSLRRKFLMDLQNVANCPTLTSQQFDALYSLRRSVVAKSGGHPFLKLYDNSVALGVMTEFPEHAWLRWKFDSAHNFGWWKQLAAQLRTNDALSTLVVREFIHTIAVQHNITHLEDWYRIGNLQIGSTYLRILDILGKLPNVLRIVYPEHTWDNSKFETTSKKSTQRALKTRLSRLYPNKEIIEEATPEDLGLPGDKYGLDDVRFDLAIKDLQLVVEYHGRHHYHDTYIFAVSQAQRKRDQLKKWFLEKHGWTLVEFPYWWPVSTTNLAEAIHASNPRLQERKGLHVAKLPEQPVSKSHQFPTRAELEIPEQITMSTEVNVCNWYFVEKYDGVRVLWDGCKFKTEEGFVVVPPAEWAQVMPSFALDGMLWIDYNKYEELVEAINSRYKLGTDVAPVNDG